MLRKNLLRALLLLGIAVNVALLLINLRPQRPHLGRRQSLKILLRAGPARAEWMREHLFREFGEAHDVDFTVVTARTFEEELQMLLHEKEHPTGIALSDIDDEHEDGLRSGGAVRPFADVAPPEELADLLQQVSAEAAEIAQPGKKAWFLPKRGEVDIAAYLRPAVEDAYLHWQQDRPAIEAALREANGAGLPRSYELERTPDEWDTYDLFVAGWYWAHHPAPWAGPAAASPRGRLAPRTAGEDGARDLLSAFFRHGIKEEEIGHANAAAILDVLQWELLFRKHHLLAPECDAAGGADVTAVNTLVHDRRAAWAIVNQPDSLWIHGGSRRDAPPGMPGPGDLQWATLPSGASLELHQGLPARSGPSYSFQEIHLWALPLQSPRPQLAFELVRFLTQRGVQQREAEAQGMLPIRRDLQSEYPIVFRLEWMQRMLDASFRQLQRGSGDTPDEVANEGLDRTYQQLRERVLAQPDAVARPTLATVRAAVAQAGGPHGQ